MDRKNTLLLLTVVLLAGTVINLYLIIEYTAFNISNTQDLKQVSTPDKLEGIQLNQQITIDDDLSHVFADSEPSQIQNTNIHTNQQFSHTSMCCHQFSKIAHKIMKCCIECYNINQEKENEQLGLQAQPALDSLSEEQSEGESSQQVVETGDPLLSAKDQSNEIGFLDKNQITSEQIAAMSRQRVKMGEPKPSPRFVRLWIIQGSPRSHLCSIMNSINVLTPASIQTLQFLVADLKMGNAIVFTDRLDNFAAQLISGNFDPKRVKFYDVQIDSDYRFVSYATSLCKCEKILYLSHHIKLKKQAGPEFQSIFMRMRSFQLIYSKRTLIQDQQYLLTDLIDGNLQEIHQSELSKYLFIFDSRYLSIITPLNFAYFARFTIEQLLILPVLSLAQKLQKISFFEPLLHSVNSSSLNFKHFSIKQPSQEPNSVCFVSYPSNPSEGSLPQLRSYLNSLRHLDLEAVIASVIIFLPYNKGGSQDFGEILKLLFEIKGIPNVARIRIRIRANKTVSSLSTFESAYTYCPPNTTIISSRHNIVFRSSFATHLAKHLSSQLHYYLPRFSNQRNQSIFISQSQLAKIREKLRQNDTIHHQYFQPVQIFNSDLLNNLYFWSIKSSELDFFQTSGSFFLPLLELVSFSVEAIDEDLFWVQRRQKTQTQIDELEMLKKYGVEQKFADKFYPIHYNCLENEALRRTPQQKIPRIIHISNVSGEADPEQFRMIKSTHPDFQIRIWNEEDISENQFSFTYSRMVRLRTQLPLGISNSYIANLIAYEILLHHGGLYLQQSSRPLKSLQPFLKYPMIYTRIVADTSRDTPHRLISIKSLLGASQNSYFLKLLLFENEQEWEIDDAVTKQGSLLGHSLNDEELFSKGGMGFHLFYETPVPSQSCGAGQCVQIPKQSYTFLVKH